MGRFDTCQMCRSRDNGFPLHDMAQDRVANEQALSGHRIVGDKVADVLKEQPARVEF